MPLAQPKGKKARALGENLFLKGSRDLSPKAAVLRRPYRPGVHGKARRRAPSEYGLQLREKQKVKLSYGVEERQFRRYFEAAKGHGNAGELLLEKLERRLDNVVFRLGFALSRSIARQYVSHGHVFVNGRAVTIPSYEVAVGEEITLKPKVKETPMFQEQLLTLKKAEPPAWLSLDKETLGGKVIGRPTPDIVQTPFNFQRIVEHYSR
ncbi:30S ribosomal protein S4 [Candidatus Azambacteria bacterium]|nr:30S ribosomal protein S4 [Candidatus Azambacteria bacterium]